MLSFISCCHPATFRLAIPHTLHPFLFPSAIQVRRYGSRRYCQVVSRSSLFQSSQLFFVSCNKLTQTLSARSEWMVNQHRDSYASYIGHHPMLSYFAVAENESIARVKFNMVEVSFYLSCCFCFISENKVSFIHAFFWIFFFFEPSKFAHVIENAAALRPARPA